MSFFLFLFFSGFLFRGGRPRVSFWTFQAKLKQNKSLLTSETQLGTFLSLSLDLKFAFSKNASYASPCVCSGNDYTSLLPGR